MSGRLLCLGSADSPARSCGQRVQCAAGSVQPALARLAPSASSRLSSEALHSLAATLRPEQHGTRSPPRAEHAWSATEAWTSDGRR